MHRLLAHPDMQSPGQEQPGTWGPLENSWQENQLFGSVLYRTFSQKINAYKSIL